MILYYRFVNTIVFGIVRVIPYLGCGNPDVWFIDRQIHVTTVRMFGATIMSCYFDTVLADHHGKFVNFLITC